MHLAPRVAMGLMACLLPAVAAAQGDPPRLPAPPSGSQAAKVAPIEGLVWRRDNDMANVRFTATSPEGGLSYLVSLYKEPEHELALIMFVSSGQTHSTTVAEGSYSIHYDAGVDWYGPQAKFGRNTAHIDVEGYTRFEADKEGRGRFLKFDANDKALYDQHASGLPVGAPTKAN